MNLTRFLWGQGFLLTLSTEKTSFELSSRFVERRHKAQVTRYLSNALSKRTGKRLDYKLPDITVLFSVSEGSIEVQPRPIWLSARYLKTERGIPQRSTICSVCRGVGCANCNFEGKTPHSIQAIITRLLKNMYRAEDCNFIWIGSEDEKS